MDILGPFQAKQQNIKSFIKHELYKETEGISFVQLKRDKGGRYHGGFPIGKQPEEHRDPLLSMSSEEKT